MNKDELITTLSSTQAKLKEIRSLLSKTNAKLVGQGGIKTESYKICRYWFDSVNNELVKFGIPVEVYTKYNNLFGKLLKLSIASTSLRKTYNKTIDAIMKDMKSDLVTDIIKFKDPITDVLGLTKLLENVPDDEKDYLTEAVNCAKNSYLRASIVLGWSAAVNRMQKKVENLGFDNFNKKTQEMKDMQEGRFKRFNKSFNIQSLNELRVSVFDNDLLWILEYWGLIDANQHDRLSLCFTMRNNCAHPGEAPLTPENLASFYSDLKLIVFDNSKFKI